jgi:hypothetical protein
MLLAIVAILIGLWLIGLVAHLAGALINVLLVVAIVVVAYRLLSGRRTM